MVLRLFWAKQNQDSSTFSETTEPIKLKFTIYPDIGEAARGKRVRRGEASIYIPLEPSTSLELTVQSHQNKLQIADPTAV